MLGHACPPPLPAHANPCPCHLHTLPAGTEQYDFIVADLKAVNRSVTPWLIVGGHRPFYISSNNRMQASGKGHTCSCRCPALSCALKLSGGLWNTLTGVARLVR